ncbi:hypothetical protein SPW_5707 [Streptomyces sp. W007]|uniref:hypothetical protein n=1 Tax=Streptomyces anulatus TaxID=1892 RepID=UPI000241B2FF|nr:hypothetical protein [Streptomyces anulatus]EHM25903.1 hypothetical protein SPW_5707 [Streptomyces sp. W007]
MTAHHENEATPGNRLVGMEYECKWDVGETSARADPDRFVRNEVFDRHLERISPVKAVSQSTLYVDDDENTLAEAGHSLGCIINHGAISWVSWLRLKQTIQWNGRRDSLEIGERVPPENLGRLINDSDVFPVSYAYRHGLVKGRLAPTGVVNQVRYKRNGYFKGLDRGISYSVDLVEFLSPDGETKVIDRYTCLEMEVNESQGEVLGRLEELARDVDRWLGHGRESRTKSQLAVRAASGVDTG